MKKTLKNAEGGYSPYPCELSKYYESDNENEIILSTRGED